MSKKEKQRQEKIAYFKSLDSLKDEKIRAIDQDDREILFYPSRSAFCRLEEGMTEKEIFQQVGPMDKNYYSNAKIHPYTVYGGRVKILTTNAQTEERVFEKIEWEENND